MQLIGTRLYKNLQELCPTIYLDWDLYDCREELSYNSAELPYLVTPTLLETKPEMTDICQKAFDL
ncbi:hypothetical protein NDI40_14160 [Microcoleus vaginatus ZQ-A3]|uniref:hypothetical protein n=1 Tax=Microcoleus vaginatus TaxID=119532 RepID=UPI001683C221|nr:hypothetical protein [Microcoleus sp. FACHB-84]MBD2008216.1 hypothetical protein [Microcoleus sp. FACHB-45]